MPTLYLRCKTCNVEFASMVSADEESFETIGLSNIEMTCPKGHAHTYDKKDYYFLHDKKKVIIITDEQRDCDHAFIDETEQRRGPDSPYLYLKCTKCGLVRVKDKPKEVETILGTGIIIDQPFAEEMKEYKISKEQIRQTVESPDKTTRLDLNEMERNLRGVYPSGRNLFVNIHLNKFVEGDKEIYLLILTREPEGESVHVVHGYKLTSDLMPNIYKDPPIDVLRGFFERFGNTMIVDGDERKFVSTALLLADENGDIPTSKGTFTEGHRLSLVQFMALRSKEYAVVMLQGSLDVTRYLDWLYTSKLN